MNLEHVLFRSPQKLPESVDLSMGGILLENSL